MSNPRLKVDASLLAKSNCPRRYYWLSQGWRSIDSINYKAEYGTAGHKALQMWYREKSNGNITNIENAAIAKAVEYFKPFEQELDSIYNVWHLEKVLRAYFELYRNDTTIIPLGEQKLTETKFLIEDFHGVDLCGTIDLPCERYGQLSICDHKFTATTQKDTFFKQFSHAIQPMFYVWAYHKMLPEIGYLPFIINGIFIKAPSGKDPDCAKFQRGDPIVFSEDRMKWFEEWLIRRINELRYFHDKNRVVPILPEFSACNQGFPLCQFASVCAHDSDVIEQALQMKFKKTDYNPLTFQE